MDRSVSIRFPTSGSSFFVELATATAAEPSDEPSEASSTRGWSVSAPGADVGGRFRVLLMEDDIANLDLVERVLSRRPGVELLAAMHGGLGIELAREHRPDLILLDLHLPDMPGTVVLDRLGEDPATAAIPVAVVGSDAAASEVRRLLGRGRGRVPDQTLRRPGPALTGGRRPGRPGGLSFPSPGAVFCSLGR